MDSTRASGAIDRGQVVGGVTHAIFLRQLEAAFGARVAGDDLLRRQLGLADQPLDHGLSHRARADKGKRLIL
jgi:hypothetical protein